MKKLIEIPEGTNIIDVRKKMNRLFSDARKESKLNRCVLCGEEQTSFCNSHSIPQFCLKNIAEKGMVLAASSVLNMDIVDVEKGVNNSGTFHIICKKCDSVYFQDYENESNLRSRPTGKILAEIAVKNTLLQLSKRYQEYKLYEKIQQKNKRIIGIETLFETKKLDIRDYEEELQFHKKNIDMNQYDGYHILFWKLLPYTVPIAIQSGIALPVDLEGNAVNNVFDLSPDKRIQTMHLAILPLKEESVIIAFYHKRDKLYRRLGHQINRSSEEKVISYLNYLIFAYTENYFISTSLKSILKNNDKLVQLSREVNHMPDLGMMNNRNNFGIGYEQVKMDEIPNFLSEEWAIHKDS